jgi:large subunit ribosomal protein L24
MAPYRRRSDNYCMRIIMSSKQPRKQRLARYTAPYHRRHREMSAPIDRGLRERQLSRGFMYPRAIPVRKGDRVMIVRGEGKTGSASKVAKIDRKARKVYVEGFTYFKSDGTELQRPIDASNLVIINPDWSDVRRRKLLNRVNESIEWTDEVVSEFEAAEDEYETETLGPIEETKDDTPEGEAEETPDKESEESDYDTMTVPLLKEALKKQGLPVSGKKAELIERLKGETLGPIEETEEEGEETPDEESDKVDYESMAVPLLKEALKEQGLPVSGKKAELIERLKGGGK